MRRMFRRGTRRRTLVAPTGGVHRTLAAPAALLIVLGLLLSGVPAASGAPALVKTAPFVRVAHVIYQDGTVTGCARLNSSAMHWNASTGVGTFRSVGSAAGCGRSSGPIQRWGISNVAAETLVAIPVHPPHAGSHPASVAVRWTVRASAAVATAMGGACPTPVLNPSSGNGSGTCVLSAEVELYVEAYLVDRTNGTYFASGGLLFSELAYNISSNTTVCRAFACTSTTVSAASAAPSFSGPQNATFWINATLNASHRYYVATYVLVDLTAEVEGIPHSQARASIDMARAGNQDRLLSVSCT